VRTTNPQEDSPTRIFFAIQRSGGHLEQKERKKENSGSSEETERENLVKETYIRKREKTTTKGRGRSEEREKTEPETVSYLLRARRGYFLQNSSS